MNIIRQLTVAESNAVWAAARSLQQEQGVEVKGPHYLWCDNVAWVEVLRTITGEPTAAYTSFKGNREFVHFSVRVGA